MKKLLGFSIATILIMALPAQAHWGPASPWTFVTQTKYCDHDHNGFDFRRVRVKVNFYSLFEDEFGGINYEDAEVKNVTGNAAYLADIFLAGYDINVPPGSFPYLAAYQNVENNGKRLLTHVYTGRYFFNLQVVCQAAPQNQF